MMRRFILSAAVSTIVALGMTMPAFAGDGHSHRHDERHGWSSSQNHYERDRNRNDSKFVINFGFPGARSYYNPYPAAYWPAPAYSQPRTVYVQTRSEPERYCREFTQQVRVGNRIQESYGTACLQPDGSWQVVP